MKLLVTGGSGFIGSNFIQYWFKKYPNDSIVNIDILTYAGNLENLISISNNPHYDYTFIKGDITDQSMLEKIVSGVDIIVHFAAESHVDRSIRNPESFIHTNIFGTYAVLEVARKHNVRLHHISTDEVFGSLEPNDDPFFEKTPYDPRSPYSASKASSDHLVRAYFHTYGLPVTVSNCSNNYGPYQFPEKLVPFFITNILQNKKVTLYGDGMNVRDWLYVEDHCGAIDTIIKKGIIGETYCIGGNNEKTNVEIARRILNYMGKTDDYIEYIKDRPGHDRRYAIDSSKIQKELFWKPGTSFDDGLKMTTDWYKENEVWWRQIQNRMRIK